LQEKLCEKRIQACRGVETLLQATDTICDHGECFAVITQKTSQGREGFKSEKEKGGQNKRFYQYCRKNGVDFVARGKKADCL